MAAVLAEPCWPAQVPAACARRGQDNSVGKFVWRWNRSLTIRRDHHGSTAVCHQCARERLDHARGGC
jgi:hypothetical protein